MILYYLLWFLMKIRKDEIASFELLRRRKFDRIYKNSEQKKPRKISAADEPVNRTVRILSNILLSTC